MDSYTWLTSIGQPTRTYIFQLCVDAGCSLDDLLGALDDSTTIIFFSRGIMAKVLECDIVLNEFELQSSYYVYFRSNTF